MAHMRTVVSHSRVFKIDGANVEPTSERGGYDVHSLRSLFVETYGNATQAHREKAFETVEKFGLILHHDIENAILSDAAIGVRVKAVASSEFTEYNALALPYGGDGKFCCEKPTIAALTHATLLTKFQAFSKMVLDEGVCDLMLDDQRDHTDLVIAWSKSVTEQLEADMTKDLPADVVTYCNYILECVRGIVGLHNFDATEIDAVNDDIQRILTTKADGDPLGCYAATCVAIETGPVWIPKLETFQNYSVHVLQHKDNMEDAVEQLTAVAEKESEEDMAEDLEYVKGQCAKGGVYTQCFGPFKQTAFQSAIVEALTSMWKRLSSEPAAGAEANRKGLVAVFTSVAAEASICMPHDAVIADLVLRSGESLRSLSAAESTTLLGDACRRFCEASCEMDGPVHPLICSEITQVLNKLRGQSGYLKDTGNYAAAMDAVHAMTYTCCELLDLERLEHVIPCGRALAAELAILGDGTALKDFTMIHAICDLRTKFRKLAYKDGVEGDVQALVTTDPSNEFITPLHLAFKECEELRVHNSLLSPRVTLAYERAIEKTSDFMKTHQRLRLQHYEHKVKECLVNTSNEIEFDVDEWRTNKKIKKNITFENYNKLLLEHVHTHSKETIQKLLSTLDAVLLGR
jgi:hypothetical protein